MEFLNNHVEITKIENKKLKEFIITAFKNFKTEGRSSEYALDKTKNKLWDTFIETNFIKKYSYHFESFYTLFSHSFDNYSPPVDITKSILKCEIFDKYKSFDKTNKSLNRQYDEDFDNLTFNDLVVWILKYHAAQIAYKQLNKNSELYKLFYTNDYYKEFTLEKFDGHVINSDLYRKTFSKFNPNSTIPVAIEKINEWKTPYYEIIEEAPKEVKNEKGKNNYSKIDDFELEEKYLILHAFYKIMDSKKYDPKPIKMTEFLRMIRICQGIEDNSMFKKDYNQKFYMSVIKGLEYYTDLNTKWKLKQNVSKKLTDLGLTNLANQVKDL